MTKKLESFLPRLMPWCLGAPEPLVYQALLDSAIAFCEETTIVHYITDPIIVIPNVADYDIDLPQGTELSRIMKLWFGTGPFDPPQSIPTNWVISAIGQVTIYPTPKQALPDGVYMFINVATKPTRSATTLADQLFNDWVEGVVGGAVMRICSMPDQPYTNLQNAQLGAQAYKLWAGKARYECSKQRVKRNTTVIARPFC